MKLKISILIIYGIIIISSVFYLFMVHVPQKISPVNSEEKKLIGSINEIKTDCWRGGSCKIKIGEVWVLVNGGKSYSGKTKGALIGLALNPGIDVAQYIGKNAEVYAKKLPKFEDSQMVGLDEENLTIYGSEDYYVKLIKSDIGADEIKFVSVFKGMDKYRCWRAGICEIDTEQGMVLWYEGDTGQSRGRLLGLDLGPGADVEQYIGKKIEVYAHKVTNLTDYNFTLYGSEKYYVKLLDDNSVPILEEVLPLEAKFTATIINFNDAYCSRTGICYLETNKGDILVKFSRNDGQPHGQIIGLDINATDTKKYFGQKIEVYAALMTEKPFDFKLDYTLYGSEKYYVKLLPN